MGNGPKRWDFRDVSLGIQKIRQFLLGRRYFYPEFHNRFLPILSPRSIPPPDIPRGPDLQYSNMWYGKRDALNSVGPPVVAPVAEGLRRKPMTQKIEFPSAPKPGMAWWFDGHCYYEEGPDAPPPPTPKDYSKPPPSNAPRTLAPTLRLEREPVYSPIPCDPCKIPKKK